MISIHAPARGATYAAGTITETEKFQSTLPRGERPVPISTQRFPRRISIHAPARGATRPCRVIHHNAASFQSTLPRGERRETSVLLTALITFQSTLPRGERRLGNRWSRDRTQFQSTLPRGERLHLLTFFRLQYGYILFHLTNKYSFCF